MNDGDQAQRIEFCKRSPCAEYPWGLRITYLVGNGHRWHAIGGPETTDKIVYGMAENLAVITGFPIRIIIEDVAEVKK